MMRLRRSFSLDFVNDDSATVFLHEHHDDHHDPPVTITVAGHHPSSSSGNTSHKNHNTSYSHTNGSSSNTSTATITNSPNGHLSSTISWHESPDIDDALAADFDGSLSGLGMEVGSSPYNMRFESDHGDCFSLSHFSDALMALPSLKTEQYHHRVHRDMHNHDALSHLNQTNDDIRPVAIVHGKKNRLAFANDEENNPSGGTKRVCISSDREPGNDARYIVFSPHEQEQQEDNDHEVRCGSRHCNSAPDLRGPSGQRQSSDSSPSPTSSSSATAIQQILSAHSHFHSPSTPSPDDVPTSRSWHTGSHSFQYVLGAATSMATRLHEETMTYLNQGQSYEVKLKKLGDLTDLRGKMLRSVVRVGFHERRLQFMEKELLNQWKDQRHSDRILEIDVPLSYGISDASNDPQAINKCSFVWEPTKEAGVFIKVNCISTEFTPKKHGGEKGVPFRLIIETHTVAAAPSPQTVLHAASSQVKVFKPKGADRKHKTDREKMSKRRPSEQDKYRPSFECTNFTDVSLDSLYWPPLPTCINDSKPTVVRKESEPLDYTKPSEPSRADTPPESPLCSSMAPLRSEASPSETIQWLKVNRFDQHIKHLGTFSGSDLMRLSRGDLIEICGIADGIRLFNCLNSRGVRPKLTIFVRRSSDDDFVALYLEHLTVAELKFKLSVIQSSILNMNRLRVVGPSDILVQVTDEVVRNFNSESMFVVDFEKGILRQFCAQE